MNIEEFRDYCLSFAGTTEDMPFGDQALVFKVLGKMFVLTNIDSFESINVKCDPQKAVDLREKYTCVQPGYHMNKKHWNTILVNDEMNDEEIRHWVRHSYELVVSKLPKKSREELRS